MRDGRGTSTALRAVRMARRLDASTWIASAATTTAALSPLGACCPRRATTLQLGSPVPHSRGAGIASGAATQQIHLCRRASNSTYRTLCVMGALRDTTLSKQVASYSKSLCTRIEPTEAAWDALGVLTAQVTMYS